MDTLRLVKSRALAIPFALSIPSAVQSILVVPSSPQCADLCGNVLSSTTSSDITCKDSSYPYSSSGVTFENCVGCEMSSTYRDPTTNETDLQFAIYNLRYALSTCLFAFGNSTNVADSPCLTSFSCGPLQAAFEYDSLYSNASVYSYCSLMNSVSIPKCSSCLAESGNEQFLSNFVTALDAACIQQPDAGSTLSLQGSVFSTTQVNITTPSPQASGSSFGSSGGLTLGAKVGIIVGGIVAIMVTLGCCIIWRGKRRRRKALATRQMQSGYAAWQAHHGPNSPIAGNSGVEGSFFDSPQSQRPLNRSWRQGESPIVGSGARNPGDHMNQFGPGYDTTFSPYSSQYTSPVSATDDRGKAVEWPRDKKPFRDDAQGHGYAGSRDLGEEVGERIEMQRVDSDNEQRWRNSAAPVLLHPGNGRGKPQGGLTEEDAKNGNAL